MLDTLINLLMVQFICLAMLLALRIKVNAVLGAIWTHRMWLIALVLPVVMLVAIGVLQHFGKHISIPVIEHIIHSNWTTARFVGSNAINWLAVFWALGSMSYLLYSICVHAYFRQSVTRSVVEHPALVEKILSLTQKNTMDVRIVKGMPGPLVMGLSKPTLVIPCDIDQRYSAKQLSLVVQHELQHMKRKDMWSNGLFQIFIGLFWFNPLLHISYRLFRVDMELACDQQMLRNRSKQVRKEYANALLLATNLPVLKPSGFTCYWFSVQNLKRRIISMKKSHSSKRNVLFGSLSIGLFSFMIAAVTWALESNKPVVEEPDGQPGISPSFHPAAEYPQLALDEQLEGWCVVEYDVAKGGSTTRIKTEKCSDDIFAKNSVDAIALWKYDMSEFPQGHENIKTMLKYQLSD